MKRLFTIAAMLVTLVVIAVLVWWKAQAVRVDFIFDYDYAVDVACPDATAVDCVEGFEILDGSSAVILSIPNPVNPTGLVTGITGTITIGPPYGQQTFSAVAVGRCATGAIGCSTDGKVRSSPTSTQAIIRPKSPENLR